MGWYMQVLGIFVWSCSNVHRYYSIKSYHHVPNYNNVFQWKQKLWQKNLLQMNLELVVLQLVYSFKRMWQLDHFELQEYHSRELNEQLNEKIRCVWYHDITTCLFVPILKGWQLNHFEPKYKHICQSCAEISA